MSIRSCWATPPSAIPADSLADDERLLPADPDPHELSIGLIVVVAGTSNPHPQEPAMGNEGPNSQTVARTYNKR